MRRQFYALAALLMFTLLAAVCSAAPVTHDDASPGVAPQILLDVADTVATNDAGLDAGTVAVEQNQMIETGMKPIPCKRCVVGFSSHAMTDRSTTKTENRHRFQMHSYISQEYKARRTFDVIAWSTFT